MVRRRPVIVRVPGSKSEAIRALVLAARGRGTTRVAGVPASGDVRAVVAALRRLGIPVRGTAPGLLRVEGRGEDLPAGPRRIACGGSATGMRLLAGLAALRRGPTVLDGDRSLRRRSMAALVAPLGAMGILVEGRRGRPPIAISGGPARRPRAAIPVDGRNTSQVASGLLLMGGIRIAVEGRAVSRPYLELTAAVLRRCGVPVTRRGRTWTVGASAPRAVSHAVEADWSSAAYPLLAGAILGLPVRVPGLRRDSLQADRAFVGILRRAGVPVAVGPAGASVRGRRRLRPFSADLRDAPDLAPAAAALALFAPGTSRITGAAHLRGKESDRIAACVAAVRALGGRAEARRDGFVVHGGAPRRGTVDPRGDHRIALAFGVAAAAVPGARVLERGCVAKSWPGAWRALAPLLRAGVSLRGGRGRG